MSLYWNIIAGFLYVEIGIIFLMLLSIVKPTVWRSLFTSKFFEALYRQSHLALYTFIVILMLFFCESVREIFKYNSKNDEHEQHHHHSLHQHEVKMHLFRSHRNFYISGFALFCLFIIKRVASLISEQGHLKISLDTLNAQIKNNVEFQKSQEKQTTDDSKDGSKCKDDEKPKISNSGDIQEVGAQVKERIAELESEIEKLKAEAVKGKSLIESKDAQIEVLKVASLKLKSMERKIEESDKDK